MSEVAEAAGSPVDKFGREWPMLDLQSYGELEVRYKTVRKEAAKATLDELGDALSPSVRADKLLEKTSQPVTYWTIEEWLKSHVGAVEALRLSLRIAGVKNKADQDVELKRIRNMDHACYLALLLAGYIIEVPKDKVKPGDKVVADASDASEAEPADPS